MEIVDIKTSYLFGENDFYNSNRILGSFDSCLFNLFLSNNVSIQRYTDLKLKYIYSLVQSNFLLDAIHHAYFMKNLCEKKLNIIQEKGAKKHLLLNFRKLFAYLSIKASQYGLIDQSSLFKQLYKNYDLKLLCNFYISDNFDNNISQAYRDGNFMQFGIIGKDLIHYDKFIKKSKFIFKVVLKIFSNVFSKYFWGYGENIKRICVNSTIIILLYSFLIFFGIIRIIAIDGNVNFITSLYFSIVTFTSLGYGDIRPTADNFSRIMMSFEALLGLICIALIVFILGKKAK